MRAFKKNQERNPPQIRRSEAARAILWIDDVTGMIVDRSLRPEPRTIPCEVVPPRIETPPLPMGLVGRVFIDLVGPRPSVTMEDGARAERTRLSARVVRLLPARGGGS